jgi:hypothetical protein
LPILAIIGEDSLSALRLFPFSAFFCRIFNAVRLLDVLSLEGVIAFKDFAMSSSTNRHHRRGDERPPQDGFVVRWAPKNSLQV